MDVSMEVIEEIPFYWGLEPPHSLPSPGNAILCLDLLWLPYSLLDLLTPISLDIILVEITSDTTDTSMCLLACVVPRMTL